MFPGCVAVTFQLPEVNRGNRQGTVIQKATHLLNRFTRFPPQPSS